MAKTKIEYPQGKNALTNCLEKILTDFGGSSWKKYTLSQFSTEVYKRLDDSKSDMKGPLLIITNNLEKRLHKKTSVQDMLMELSETLFKFSEGSDDK
jgi:hypothetical protein